MTSPGLPDLRIGVIFDSFHSDGNLPKTRLLLKRWLKDREIDDAQFFKSFAGILSGPVALSSSSEIRTLCTSLAVISMSEMVTLGASV